MGRMIRVELKEPEADVVLSKLTRPHVELTAFELDLLDSATAKIKRVVEAQKRAQHATD